MSDLFEGRMTVGEVKRQAKRVLAEAKSIDARWSGKEMPGEVVLEYKAKVDRAAELKSWLDEVPPGATPIPLNAAERKKRDEGEGQMEAKMSPGQAFIESMALKMYVGDGCPPMPSARANVPPFETKAVPTLGSGVIDPQRFGEIARHPDELRPSIRDVLSIVPATSGSVEFLRVTSALPESAETVAEGAPKPESTMTVEKATAPVRLIAVWMPVTEQQLADFPQIRQLVDDDLTFDIKRLEEHQLVWGGGTGEDLLGIMESPGVSEMTRTLDVGAGSTVTLWDRIRAAVSDVVAAGHSPNALLIHPFDLEALSIGKGSDDHYLTIALALGSRTSVWNLRVIETLAAENRRAGLSTNQRVAIVGDFRRGATLWDRMQTSVSVGYINDQFTRNQRTLLAEERLAFGVRRPSAFKWIETVEASAS